MFGIVDNYAEAIVRERPDVFADPVCRLPQMTKVEIDPKASTVDFYKVYTSTGVGGYCLKFYLTVEQ